MKKDRATAITAKPRSAMADLLESRADGSKGARPARKPVSPMKVLLQAVSSLKVTVVLLSCCMVLVLWGTLAQKDLGINSVVANYFRSWVAWVPLRVIFLLQIKTQFAIPVPGGWTWGALLMINLVSAHLSRFKLTWKKIGMWMVHSGIVMLMVGEIVTGLFAVESRMVIEEGKSTAFLEDHHKSELTFIDPSDPEKNREVSIPDALLRRKARGSAHEIACPDLPFNVVVKQFMVNSALLDQIPPDRDNLATQGAGVRHLAESKPEVSGTDPEQPVDLPSVYVELIDKKSSQSLGTWLVSMHLKDQRIDVDGKNYEVTLRFARTYLPYEFHLTKFTHDVYPGTDKPKDYRSHIQIVDPANGTERDTEIYMNAPLFYRGRTYYQSGVLDQRIARGTILQVVQNPGWALPYISCFLVSMGMLVHFGIRFSESLKTPASNREAVG